MAPDDAKRVLDLSAEACLELFDFIDERINSAVNLFACYGGVFPLGNVSFIYIY